MFENYRVFKTMFAGRELTVETGKVCGLANGSCWVRYGETVVMVNVAASAKPRDGVDFFPLSVDYEEKLYAVGKIPGGFLKREGRPSEPARIKTKHDIHEELRAKLPQRQNKGVACQLLVLIHADILSLYIYSSSWGRRSSLKNSVSTPPHCSIRMRLRTNGICVNRSSNRFTTEEHAPFLSSNAP